MSLVNEEIYSRAAEWAAKRDLGGLTPEEDAEFSAWLAADIRHLGAYGRAEAVLERLKRVPSSAVAAACLDATEPYWSRRRIVLTGSIAASFATVVVGAGLWQRGQTATYATGIGQVREVVLSDGSVVTLNTNTRVGVNFTKDVRQIHLVQGEALFDVAKNKKRPFIVVAGDTKVRAVGTSFVVSMLPQRPVQVLVKEGVVELDRSISGKSMPARVSANTQVLASTDARFVAIDVPIAKVEREMAWRFGRIALDNQTLQDASETFARYSDIRLVVDPAVANRTVTGMFVANDPVAFAKAAAAVLNLRIEMSSGQVKLFDKSDGDRVGKM